MLRGDGSNSKQGYSYNFINTKVKKTSSLLIYSINCSVTSLTDPLDVFLYILQCDIPQYMNSVSLMVTVIMIESIRGELISSFSYVQYGG